MSIKATCGGCGKTYAINEKYADKRLPCKECGEKFLVPGGDDFDNFEDDFEPPPTRRRHPAGGSPGRGGPRRGSAAPARNARRRPKRRRRSSGPNWTVIGISAGAGVAGLTLIVVLILTNSGSSPESLTEDLLEGMNELADVLESVQDVESAESAAPQIERICDRMAETVRKASLISPSKAEDDALYEKYGDRMDAAECRLNQEVSRVFTLDGVPEVLRASMMEFALARREFRRRTEQRNRNAPPWLQ